MTPMSVTDLLNLLDTCDHVAYDYRYAVGMQRIGEQYVAQGPHAVLRLWQIAEQRLDEAGGNDPNGHRNASGAEYRATWVEPTWAR